MQSSSLEFRDGYVVEDSKNMSNCRFTVQAPKALRYEN